MRAAMRTSRLAIAIAVAILSGIPACDFTADATDGGTALWLYARDARPGDHLSGSVRASGDIHVAIESVTVEIPTLGYRRTTTGDRPHWGQVVTAGPLTSAAAELDFDFEIPDTAAPGHLQLRVVVDDIVASRNYDQLQTFSNHSGRTTFVRTIDVYPHQTSVLRRAGKAALVLGAWLLFTWGCIAVIRVHFRRRRPISPGWWLAMLPHLAVGCFFVVGLVDDATRLHGWWLTLPTLAGWSAVPFAALRWTRHEEAGRFVVTPARVAVSEAAPYRTGAAPPTATVEELEHAFLLVGLFPQRRRELQLVSLGTDQPVAYVALPDTGRFGDAPFEIRAVSRARLVEVVRAAATKLGDLRWHEVGQPGEFLVRAGSRPRDADRAE